MAVLTAGFRKTADTHNRGVMWRSAEKIIDVIGDLGNCLSMLVNSATRKAVLTVSFPEAVFALPATCWVCHGFFFG